MPFAHGKFVGHKFIGTVPV